ncbi:hypothetical protein KJ632_05470 [Patescibacteria group bacterium]|nr:hypothetical protein [Patescibacteria group bacterium]
MPHKQNKHPESKPSLDINRELENKINKNREVLKERQRQKRRIETGETAKEALKQTAAEFVIANLKTKEQLKIFLDKEKISGRGLNSHQEIKLKNLNERDFYTILQKAEKFNLSSKVFEKINPSGPINAVQLGKESIKTLLKKIQKQEQQKKLLNTVLVSPTRLSDLLEVIKELRGGSEREKKLSKYIANHIKTEIISSALTNYANRFSAKAIHELYNQNILGPKDFTKGNLVEKLSTNTIFDLHLLFKEESPAGEVQKILKQKFKSKIATIDLEKFSTKRILKALDSRIIKIENISEGLKNKQILLHQLLDTSANDKMGRSFFELMKADTKLEAAGFILEGESIVFHIPPQNTPGTTKRSFNKSKAEQFLNTIMKSSENQNKSIHTLLEKVRLNVYQNLLQIIIDDNSINQNQYNIRNFRKSNAELILRITKLEKQVSESGELSKSRISAIANKKIAEATLGNRNLNHAKVQNGIATTSKKTSIKEVYKELKTVWGNKENPFSLEEFKKANNNPTINQNQINSGITLNMPFLPDDVKQKVFETQRSKKTPAERTVQDLEKFTEKRKTLSFEKQRENKRTQKENEYLNKKFENYTEEVFTLDQSFGHTHLVHTRHAEEDIAKNYIYFKNSEAVTRILTSEPFTCIDSTHAANFVAQFLSEGRNNRIDFNDFINTKTFTRILDEKYVKAIGTETLTETDYDAAEVKHRSKLVEEFKKLHTKVIGNIELTKNERAKYEKMKPLILKTFELLDALKTLSYAEAPEGTQLYAGYKGINQDSVIDNLHDVFTETGKVDPWDSFTGLLSASNTDPNKLTMIDLNGKKSVMTRDEFTKYYHGDSALLKLLNEKGICGESIPSAEGQKRPINMENLHNRITKLMKMGRQILIMQKKHGAETAETKDFPQLNLPKFSANSQTEINNYFNALKNDPNAKNYLKVGFMVSEMKKQELQNREGERKLAEILGKRLPEPLAKMQSELISKGVPKAVVEKAIRNLQAMAYIRMENGKFKGAGGGANIPLGEGFSLQLSLGYDKDAKHTANVAAGIGLTITLLKNDNVYWTTTPAVSTLGAGLGTTIGGDVDGVDLSGTVFFGIDWTAKGGLPGVGLNINWGNKVQRARFRTREEEISQKVGLKELWEYLDQEQSLSPKEKMQKIKSIPKVDAILKDLADEMPEFFNDPKLSETEKYSIFFKMLTMYKEKLQQNQVQKDFTWDDIVPGMSVGIGVMIAFALAQQYHLMPIGLAGILIKTNQRQIFIPKRSAKIKVLNQATKRNLHEQMQAKIENMEKGIGLNEWKLGTNAYLSTNGDVGVITSATESELLREKGTIDTYNDAFENVRVGIKPAGKSHELIVEDADDKVVQIYIDPELKNASVRLNPTDGKIYITGQLSDLVITRKNIEFNRPMASGTSNLQSTIYIRKRSSVKGDRSESWIEKNSSKMLRKFPGEKWETSTLDQLSDHPKLTNLGTLSQNELELQAKTPNLEKDLQSAVQFSRMRKALNPETIVIEGKDSAQILRALAAIENQGNFAKKIKKIMEEKNPEIRRKKCKSLILQRWQYEERHEISRTFPKLEVFLLNEKQIIEKVLQDHSYGKNAEQLREKTKSTAEIQAKLDTVYNYKIENITFEKALRSAIDDPIQVLQLIEKYIKDAQPDLIANLNDLEKQVFLNNAQNYLTVKYFTTLYPQKLPGNEEILNMPGLEKGSFITAKRTVGNKVIYLTNSYQAIIHDTVSGEYSSYLKRAWTKRGNTPEIKALREMIAKQRIEIKTANREVLKRLKGRRNYEKAEFAIHMQEAKERLKARGQSITSTAEAMSEKLMSNIYDNLITNVDELNYLDPPKSFLSLDVYEIERGAFLVSGSRRSRTKPQLTKFINYASSSRPDSLPYAHGFLEYSQTEYKQNLLRNDKTSKDLMRVLFEMGSPLPTKNLEKFIKESPLAKKLLATPAISYLLKGQDYENVLKAVEAIQEGKPIPQNSEASLRKFIQIVNKIRAAQIDNQVLELDSPDKSLKVRIDMRRSSVKSGAYSKCGNATFAVNDLGTIRIKKPVSGEMTLVDESIIGQGVENDDFGLFAIIGVKRKSKAKETQTKQVDKNIDKSPLKPTAGKVAPGTASDR